MHRLCLLILTSSFVDDQRKKKVCVLCMSYLSLLVFSLLIIIVLFYFIFFVAFARLIERILREVCPRTVCHSFFFFPLFCLESTGLSFVVHSACNMRNSFLAYFRNRILDRDTTMLIQSAVSTSNLRVKTPLAIIFRYVHR